MTTSTISTPALRLTIATAVFAALAALCQPAQAAAPEGEGSKSQQLKVACLHNPQHPICQEMAAKQKARKEKREAALQAKIDEILGKGNKPTN